LQQEIVVGLIRSIDDRWERIVVNYEIQEEDGGLIEARLAFYVARDETGRFREVTLTFDARTK
jgi:hypothetical protein